MRRVVQKRADDADRRKREAKEKAESASAAAGELGSLEARKQQDRERLALAAKVRLRMPSAASPPSYIGILLGSWHRPGAHVSFGVIDCGLRSMPPRQHQRSRNIAGRGGLFLAYPQLVDLKGQPSRRHRGS